MIAGRAADRPVQSPLWRAMLDSDQPITVPELVTATAIGAKQVDSRLNLWVAAGLVLKQPGKRTSPGRFILSPDAPRTPEPPMIDRHGRAIPKAPASYERIWSAIRVRKTFDLAELQLMASVEKRSCLAYLGVLQRTGYVRMVSCGHRHTGPSRYRLVRNTGRLAPRETARTQGGVRIRVLIDRNTDTQHDISCGAPSARMKSRNPSDGGVG